MHDFTKIIEKSVPGDSLVHTLDNSLWKLIFTENVLKPLYLPPPSELPRKANEKTRKDKYKVSV